MKTRHFAMCFEEFVKQHGVDLIVALSLGIASHRIGIHLGDMLSDQAEGKCLRGIILFVVGGSLLAGVRRSLRWLCPSSHFWPFTHFAPRRVLPKTNGVAL